MTYLPSRPFGVVMATADNLFVNCTGFRDVTIFITKTAACIVAALKDIVPQSGDPPPILRSALLRVVLLLIGCRGVSSKNGRRAVVFCLRFTAVRHASTAPYGGVHERFLTIYALWDAAKTSHKYRPTWPWRRRRRVMNSRASIHTIVNQARYVGYFEFSTGPR